ncbi:helix-turn-helix transcriptional regulator [Halomarina litorea]|uniref:helix-turn-helix transcriptional regulator n=1 Tax=Halomarina litorea TaxID=2961595 RepID=UPI0020C27BD6|nr:hypothetical protein [Halomarina sp. BCD28]
MARPWLVVVLLTLLVAPVGHGGVATALDAGADTAVGASDGSGLGVDVGPATDERTAPGDFAALGERTGVAAAQSQEFDRTVFSIEVYENGSARWTFSYRRSLANESERAQFEAYAEEFNAEETATYRDFMRRADALVRAGANETGREMSATDFRREASVSNLGNQGIVEMSFRWDGFAVTEGDRVVVGDVFEGGLYIGPTQRFVVRWESSLEPRTTEPPPTQNTSDSLVWSGGENGIQFLDGQPRVVFGPATNGTGDGSGAGGGAGTAGPNDSGLAGDVGTPDDGDDLPLWPLVVGVVVVVGSVGVAARRGHLTPESDGEDGSPGADVGTPSDGDGGVPATDPPEPAVPDEEFMTDEDRVLAMLDANGGRMKQVNIVEESDWSKSKVSMLLSEMEEAGRISKLRVGRENIISRAGDEPAASRSQFDDDA